MQEGLQDADIIQLVLRGQQQAFAVLVERYQHFVFTVTLRYAANREDAEELAQDTFIKAYRFLADFNGKSKFSTWLYTIAHNTCLSHKRKNPGVAVSVAEEQINMMAERRGLTEATPNASEERSQKALLAKAIQKLPAQDAELISLFYMAEQSLEEIGVIVGFDTNRVKVRLFRARQKLKAIIEKYYRVELNYYRQ